MKVKTVWYCSSCGSKQYRWSGQCSSCSSWNTMQEEQEMGEKKGYQPLQGALSKKESKPLRLKEIQPQAQYRLETDLKEFDRLIGGGIVPGAFTLIGGDPGIGKSTLCLHIAKACATKGAKVLYVSGEESLEQTALRAERLNIHDDNVFFLHERDLHEIIKQIEAISPTILIIDSIQIVYNPELPSVPGSVTQVREAATFFMQLAKSKHIATFIIGHVTKSGEIAGPKILEHLVDTVLYFEGDKQQQFRLLRVVKNRFGPTDEVAIFHMHNTGLEEIKNPSQIFLEGRVTDSTGSVIIPTLEGTRPILIEVQSLVTNTYFPSPSRRSTGVDLNRLALLLAVLEKRCKLQLHQCDVFVSVTGGIRVSEPACDLGVLMAITSSFCNRKIDSTTLVIGEVGLGGEIRAVNRLESRLKEGLQMGFSHCIVPKRNIKGIHDKDLLKKIQVQPVEWVDEAIDMFVK